MVDRVDLKKDQSTRSKAFSWSSKRMAIGVPVAVAWSTQV